VRLVIGQDLSEFEREGFWATMSAPAFDADGDATLQIALGGFDEPIAPEDVERYSESLLRSTARITELVGKLTRARVG
jgi:hypothetical protein